MSRRVLYKNFQSSDSGASEEDVSRRTSWRSLSREWWVVEEDVTEVRREGE
jgi:hypothetical protein